MYCQSCGNQIPDNSKFCNVCGFKQGEITPSKKTSPPIVVKPSIDLILPESTPAPRRDLPATPAGNLKTASEKPKVTAKATPTISTTAKATAQAMPVTSPPQVQTSTLVTPSASKLYAPVGQVTTSGDWDTTDFVHSFIGRKMPALKVSGSNGISEKEARDLFWKSYQSEIKADLDRWIARGWEPTTIIGPEAFVLRKFNGYRDKNALFWVIVIIAAIPSVGMSLIWGLIPSGFVEPTQFVAKLRARHRTPLP